MCIVTMYSVYTVVLVYNLHRPHLHGTRSSRPAGNSKVSLGNGDFSDNSAMLTALSESEGVLQNMYIHTASEDRTTQSDMYFGAFLGT